MSFEVEKIIFDTSIIIAIIAINMTVIGLTSLAETKKIIGVDYGRFLVKKYRVIGSIRIYELLIIFAIINISSLFFMFVQTYQFRLVHFILLTISLVFAIYYFFSYIISENKKVKKQIFEDELLGLYYSSDNFNHQEADVLTKMSGGSRTSKKLSSNVVSYFDTYNSSSQEVFGEVFGDQSVIYDYSAKGRKKLRKLYNISPYIYRKSENGIYDISYEYFQLFRGSEQQFKWTFEILRIFDGDRQNIRKFDLFRLYNFSRILTHVNLFGSNEVFKYKFLEYLVGYYYQAVAIRNDELERIENKEHLTEVEEYTFQQLLEFMFKAGGNHRDTAFFQKANIRTRDIIFHGGYKGTLKTEELLLLLLDKALEIDSNDLKDVFTELLDEYYGLMEEQIVPEELEIVNVRQYIKEYQNKNKISKIGITAEELFSLDLGENVMVEKSF